MIGEIRQNFTEASASVGLILATALTRYYEKSSWWSKRGIKPRISEMRAFHALTTQYHNASIT